MSYLRSVHFQKNKEIFKLEELPLERFAESLGLPGAPKVKFLNKEIAKRKKNASHEVLNAESVRDSGDIGSDGSASESEADESGSGSESEGDSENVVEVEAKASEPQKVCSLYARFFRR